ncbi:MAG: glycyl-radical enzyme activating protein [Desulfococcaceae bacterium]|jgi:pyruvate formate lyase activating enzyme|nr:glycyl-radical enzyme activating protein [Desulfococcaceae bacterium]
MQGIIFNIKKYAIHDGPGIRTTVFFKGCPLKCPWCHNPEGISFAPQQVKKMIRGDGEKKNTVREEIIGRSISPADLLAEIEKDRIFYEESGGGVTFSGGEPLAQPDFLKQTLRLCRQRDIHTATDSSGYAPGDILSGIADESDLFLFDLKIMDDEKHRLLTGVSNRGILANLKLLSEKRKNIMIRIPLIPGYTDDGENLAEMRGFLSALPGIREISLLPFHNSAEGKYRKLGKHNAVKDIPRPDPESMEKIRKEFVSGGFHVKIGG